MANSSDKTLERELKELIVKACNLGEVGIQPDDIPDEVPLIDPDSSLGIDSLDAVEIVVAVETRYGVRIRDIDTSRKVLRSIKVLADFIRTNREL